LEDRRAMEAEKPSPPPKWREGAPPKRTRPVHGWGSLLNHACEEHACFSADAGWGENASFRRVREAARGEEATVFYSEEEDLPCARCELIAAGELPSNN